ncbi:MAG TPA: type II toxin-antitoxin system RelE/ParE family toxin [Edaphobacter sp.]|nr:type II toxin-antitoxin system RelE/ParE family toxin [Edaphobacter sp.]
MGADRRREVHADDAGCTGAQRAAGGAKSAVRWWSFREVLSSFPDDVKRSLGFSLRQLQIGRQPTSQTRSMSSIGTGVYELKEADERAWYRVVYLSKIENRIYVLHSFEKESRKTDRRDIEIARQRLKLVRRRLQEQKSHEERSGK